MFNINNQETGSSIHSRIMNMYIINNCFNSSEHNNLFTIHCCNITVMLYYVYMGIKKYFILVHCIC